MKFRNSLGTGDKKISRGDRCLLRGSWEAIYLGSFMKDGECKWNHMLLVQACYSSEVQFLEESLVISNNSHDISWKAQMNKPLEGQMALC